MKRFRYAIIMGGALLFAVFSVRADTLSLRDFVRIVLHHNPQQKISANAVAMKNAAVGDARSNLLPQVGGRADFSRSESPGSASRPQTTDVNSFSATITGSMPLFDFGAGRYKYKATGKALEASKFDSQSSRASLILNARTAYFNYVLSKKLLAVSEDASKQAHTHLNQAVVLVQVGKQAHIEVTKARVTVANAEVGVIHAQNSVALAKVQMEVAAGCEFADSLVCSDSLGTREDSLALSDALERAFQKRPELLSLRAGVEAARLQLRAARAAFFPSLNAYGNAGWNPRDNAAIKASDFSKTPDWTVGAELSVPIYQGGKLNASLSQSNASLGQNEAQLEALKLVIGQNIRQYILQEQEALKRIGATETLIEQAEEGLKLSQERFQAGVAFSIEITDAEVTLANARESHAQAQYDYHVAHANLLFATGSLSE